MSNRPQIGEYTQTADSFLGGGNVGTVLLVKNFENTSFALKIIPLNDEGRQNKIKEAKIGGSLDHQNIIKTRESFFFNQQTQLAIVMEYYPEGSLAQKIGHLNQEQSLKLIKGIIKGMVYLHDKKIMHRDIKPQNILIKEGVPKIADFGMATILLASRTRSRMGTEMYRSPEIHNGQEYDFSSDIWSLGITFIEVLLGRRISSYLPPHQIPVHRKDFPSNQLMNQIENEKMRNIIKKMLNREPTKRPKIQKIYQELYVKVYKPQKLNESSKLQFVKILNQNQLFPNIHQIILGFIRIKDNQLKSFAENSFKFPNLQKIYFGNNKITGKGLKYFAENCSKFENLQQINFCNNKITNKGLKSFAENSYKFPNLQQINFCNNNIKNQGLRYFAEKSSKFPNLQQINFCNNKITIKKPKLLFNNLQLKVLF